MHNEIFIDGISEISVTGPTVRIDTFTLSPSEKDAGGNPRPIPRQRIVMTLEGFMNVRELVERVASELIEGGVVRRRDSAAKAETVSLPRCSPNFPSKYS